MSSELIPRSPSGADQRAALDELRTRLDLLGEAEQVEDAPPGMVSVQLSLHDLGRLFHGALCSCNLNTDDIEDRERATEALVNLIDEALRVLIDEAKTPGAQPETVTMAAFGFGVGGRERCIELRRRIGMIAAKRTAFGGSGDG